MPLYGKSRIRHWNIRRKPFGRQYIIVALSLLRRAILPYHWRIQGAPLVRAPPSVQILSFLHTNFPQCRRIGPWRPPYEVGAPTLGNPGSATAYHTPYFTKHNKLGRCLVQSHLPSRHYCCLQGRLCDDRLHFLQTRILSGIHRITCESLANKTILPNSCA